MNKELSTVKKDNLKKSNQESKSLTREYIKTALILLLKEKPFEKITVTSIIERAGVSRAGFYRNYGSKEEVLDDFCSSVYHQMASYFMDERYTDNPELLYTNIFKKAKENQEMLQLILHVFISNNYYIDRSLYIQRFYNPQTSKDYYFAIANLQARRSILMEWIQSGMKESPKEMADILIELFHT